MSNLILRVERQSATLEGLQRQNLRLYLRPTESESIPRRISCTTQVVRQHKELKFLRTIAKPIHKPTVHVFAFLLTHSSNTARLPIQLRLTLLLLHPSSPSHLFFISLLHFLL